MVEELLENFSELITYMAIGGGLAILFGATIIGLVLLGLAVVAYGISLYFAYKIERAEAEANEERSDE